VCTPASTTRRVARTCAPHESAHTRGPRTVAHKIHSRKGHESTQTTHIYEHADPALKERAIARTAPLGVKPGRYRASDTLLAFLEAL